MKLVHLAKRFVGSLWPFGPSTTSTAWAHEHLVDGERRLWNRMRSTDRRHSIAVARRVERSLGVDATRPVIAAALLHDVGKIESDLGTIRRVLATCAIAVAGHDTADLWVGSRGVTRRFGLYAAHPRIGAEMIEMAGGDPLTVAWAREHHLPEEQWSVELRVAAALHAADDD